MFLDAGAFDEGLLFLRIGLPVMMAKPHIRFGISSESYLLQTQIHSVILGNTR